MRPTSILKISQTRAPIPLESQAGPQQSSRGLVISRPTNGGEGSGVGNSNKQQTSSRSGACPAMLGTEHAWRTVSSKSHKAISFVKTQSRAKKAAAATPTQQTSAKVLRGKPLTPFSVGRRAMPPIPDPDENQPAVGRGGAQESTAGQIQVELERRRVRQGEGLEEEMGGPPGGQEQNRPAPMATVGFLRYDSMAGLRGVTVQSQNRNLGTQAHGPWTAAPRHQGYSSPPTVIQPTVVESPLSQQTRDGEDSSLFFPNEVEEIDTTSPHPSPTLQPHHVDAELWCVERQDRDASVIGAEEAKLTSPKKLKESSTEPALMPGTRKAVCSAPNYGASDNLSPESTPIRQQTGVGTPNPALKTKRFRGEDSAARAFPVAPVDVHHNSIGLPAGGAASTMNPVVWNWSLPPTSAAIYSRLSQGTLSLVEPMQGITPSLYSSTLPTPSAPELQHSDPDAMELDSPGLAAQLANESVNLLQHNLTAHPTTLEAIHQHPSEASGPPVDTANTVSPSTGLTTSKVVDPAVLYRDAMSIYFKAQPCDPTLDAFLPIPGSTVDSATPPLTLTAFIIKSFMEGDQGLQIIAMHLAKTAWLGLDHESSAGNANGPLVEFWGSLLSASWDVLLGQLGLCGAPDQMEARMLLADHVTSGAPLYTAESFKVKLEERLAASFASMERKEVLAAMISGVEGWGMGWWGRVHSVLAEGVRDEKPFLIHVLWTEKMLLLTLKFAVAATRLGFGLEQAWRTVIKRERPTGEENIRILWGEWDTWLAMGAYEEG